jgi:rare lipoprotein A
VNSKIKAFAARCALAAGAAVALSGTIGTGHAETAIELPVALAAPAALEGAPMFQPSTQANPQQGFATPSAEQASGAPAITEPAAPAPVAKALGSGVASFYARRFAGRPTASGERFDPELLTAAHRSLPFGSQVRVTNARNGRSVVVRINDRGPFHGGRTIDLSPRAAEEIGIVSAGHGRVELALLED